MIRLQVFCPLCGKRRDFYVQESCPPSTLRCRCGMKFPLNVEEEVPRPLPEDTVDMAEFQEEVESLNQL